MELIIEGAMEDQLGRRRVLHDAELSQGKNTDHGEMKALAGEQYQQRLFAVPVQRQNY